MAGAGEGQIDMNLNKKIGGSIMEIEAGHGNGVGLNSSEHPMVFPLSSSSPPPQPTTLQNAQR